VFLGCLVSPYSFFLPDTPAGKNPGDPRARGPHSSTSLPLPPRRTVRALDPRVRTNLGSGSPMAARAPGNVRIGRESTVRRTCRGAHPPFRRRTTGVGGDAHVPGKSREPPDPKVRAGPRRRHPKAGRRRGSSRRACRRKTPARAVGRVAHPDGRPDREAGHIPSAPTGRSRAGRMFRVETSHWEPAAPAEAGRAMLAGDIPWMLHRRPKPVVRTSREAIPPEPREHGSSSGILGRGWGPTCTDARGFRHAILHPLPSGQTGLLRRGSAHLGGAGSAPDGRAESGPEVPVETGCSNQPASALWGGPAAEPRGRGFWRGAYRFR